jgi:ribosomal protein S18 acetylase RimI-like enzyme
MGTVTVRPAREDELDAAGAAVLAAYEADGLHHPTYSPTIADARARAQDAEVAVAVDDAGRVLGSVTFALAGGPWAQLAGPGEAEFRMLGVLPDARGQGVGALLTEWCVRRAVELGRHRLVLSSSSLMVAAHRLYRRRGFVRRPELDWSPDAGVSLLGFSLDLP